MPRLKVLLVFLASGVLLMGCQGDASVPSDPGRGLGVTAGGPCKDNAFTNAAAIYTDSSVQNAKLQACKDILNYFKQNDLDQGHKGINDLLVGIFNDYDAQVRMSGPATLAPVGSSLAQSFADYVAAACGLAGNKLSASECLKVNDWDGGGIGPSDVDTWGAWGPLSGSETCEPPTCDRRLLPNGLFAFRINDPVNAYVFVSRRPSTTKKGPCPGNFPKDCEQDVYDVDVDAFAFEGGSFTDADVESCVKEYGVKHVRCPDGNCVEGETTNAVGLVTSSACTTAGYLAMGFWGKTLFQATQPVHWIIHATPAYAAVSTKFGAFSPVALSDDDDRTRRAFCSVTANYPSGSEGTICQLLDQGAVISQCVTTADAQYVSSCPFVPDVPVPGDVTYTATANKTGTNGAYSAQQNVTFKPGDPERGQSKTIEFNLQPPGGGKGKKN